MSEDRPTRPAICAECDHFRMMYRGAGLAFYKCGATARKDFVTGRGIMRDCEDVNPDGRCEMFTPKVRFGLLKQLLGLK